MLEEWIEESIGKKEMKAWNKQLSRNGIENGFPVFLRSVAIEGAAFSLIVLCGAIYFKLNLEFSIVIFIASFFLPAIVNYFFQLYITEKQRKEMESFIPDVLLQCSIFSKETPIQTVLKYISEAEYGRLSLEFKQALNELEKGSTVEECLSNIAIRCQSRIVDRAINLLIQGYKSGKNMTTVFSESANDLLETGSIMRERSASLMIEKWTILVGGAIIVPSILGTLVGMVAKLNFGNLSFLGIGLSETARTQLLHTILASNQIYLIEYAVLASIFVAQQEGSTKKAILYILILIPASVGIYHAIQWLKV